MFACFPQGISQSEIEKYEFPMNLKILTKILTFPILKI